MTVADALRRTLKGRNRSAIIISIPNLFKVVGKVGSCDIGTVSIFTKILWIFAEIDNRNFLDLYQKWKDQPWMHK